ncbi:AMP-binding protein [Sphingomonas abaci]|uniref:3-methylmercaptopropionyl-CoA ligase n=1 Tax=Sphingomonas abaci TaxID=237611 RepID=A0A7W7AHT2_9SPHN|nr:AMP-binding protein [Sphingomonas abaci]MBB4616302.1 acyl-CoA synthetase (AMP-forming)/AMP-acid ligase II [Sphingomonas abaci]
MRLIDYLDKGASLGGDAPCLTTEGRTLSYAEVQRHSHRVARALSRDRIAPGEHVAVLSGNDPIAFATVFAISRAACVWCPINPRNEAAENGFVLDAFDCVALFFEAKFAALVDGLRAALPRLRLLVCLDAEQPFAPALEGWLAGVSNAPFHADTVSDLAMLPGTGGTTGQPKGVMLSHRNLETMTALTLMGYPFVGRPVYLAMAPLTHAAGVLALPILCHGGEIVIMAHPDIGDFLRLAERHRVTHSFLPPTLIYMLLDHPDLPATDLSALQCFWYGAAPISAARLEEALTRIGPVMAQLFGQTEAPMMISMMAPEDHFDTTGAVARHRLSSAGRPGPLVQVAILDGEGREHPRGGHGEIVVRSSLVMDGYYKNPAATAEATIDGWHRTGDIGYLDEDNFLFIVDRAKDMIITGGFNVYSAEVEQALMTHPAVQDAAVFGLPDEKWGERVCAAVQLRAGQATDAAAIIAHVKAMIGSVKTPKTVEICVDLPRSKVGKVLKKDIRARHLVELAAASGTRT